MLADRMWQAKFDQRAVVTTRIIHRLRGLASLKDSAHERNCVLDPLTQIIREINLASAMRAAVIDGAFGHTAAEHLFQADRLSTKLQIGVNAHLPRPMLVLDRVGNVAVELDNISPTDESEAFRPAREGALDPDTRARRRVALINPLVFQASPKREDILII